MSTLGTPAAGDVTIHDLAQRRRILIAACVALMAAIAAVPALKSRNRPSRAIFQRCRCDNDYAGDPVSHHLRLPG